MLLRSHQHKKMPWKNGGGITYEIDRQPNDSGEDFHWRLAMAEIKYPGGPFSIFPNIDRTLSIIDGHRLKLTLNNQQSIEIDRNSPPFSFQGETPIESEIFEDTVTDLNVMTRRDQCKHDFEKVVVKKNQDTIQISNDQNQQILYVIIAQGDLQIGDINITKGDVIKLTDYQQSITLFNFLNTETIIFLIKIITSLSV